MFEVRLAQPTDSADIADLIRVSLDDDTDHKRIEAVMGENDHVTCVAAWDGRVVGFADGFITSSCAGVRRWELDLLCVSPTYRSKGIGKSLIMASTDTGRDMGAIVARALVAQSNLSMQSALKANGYSCVEEDYELFIASGNPYPKSLFSDFTHLVHVNTLTYSGIWLEGNITMEGIDLSKFLCWQNQLDIVGSVVSHEDVSTIQLLRDRGFEFVKDFHWWATKL